MLKKILTITFLISLLPIIVACNNTEESKPKEEDHTNESNASEPASSSEKSNSFPGVQLKKGDEGEQVAQLQKALNDIGYEIKNTAIFDTSTTWAITDFQLQQESLHATGLYDEETKKSLKEFHKNDTSIDAGKALAPPEQPETLTQEIENPYDVLALINKQYALPADYIPADLVVPDIRFPFTEDLPKKQLRQVAADALEQLFVAADEEGLELFAQSGYRSYERQDAIFASNVEQHGEEAANNFSARPGESEHQSGLTMDVTTPDMGFQLNTDFGTTPEGKWLVENASDYGFIIRYPEGKEDITQYQYEPWHLRYVGQKAAQEIMAKNITLEEYLGVQN